jgi:hypothetical protein
MGFRQGPSEFLVFYAEGVESTVAVFDVPDQNFKVSFVNGRIEVPTLMYRPIMKITSFPKNSSSCSREITGMVSLVSITSMRMHPLLLT